MTDPLSTFEPWRTITAQQELAQRALEKQQEFVRLGDEAIEKAKGLIEQSGSGPERAQAWALIAQAYYMAVDVRRRSGHIEF